MRHALAPVLHAPLVVVRKFGDGLSVYFQGVTHFFDADASVRQMTCRMTNHFGHHCSVFFEPEAVARLAPHDLAAQVAPLSLTETDAAFADFALAA